jgi:hypothetical protein
MDNAVLSLTEHAHMAEMEENLRRKLDEARKTDMGRGDGLRRQMLSWIVREEYESAKNALDDYIEGRGEFTEFQRRARRHVVHCHELIQAIQTKRGFPGIGQLSLSRQQEIHEKVLQHFEELKANLKQIERIERDSHLADVRSTVWVLRALSATLFLIAVAWFMVDLNSGLLSSAVYVAGGILDEFSFWFVQRLGL